MANTAELDIIIQIQNRAGDALRVLTRDVNNLAAAFTRLDTKGASIDRLNRLLATTVQMSGSLTSTGNAIKDMSDKFAGFQLLAPGFRSVTSIFTQLKQSVSGVGTQFNQTASGINQLTTAMNKQAAAASKSASATAYAGNAAHKASSGFSLLTKFASGIVLGFGASLGVAAFNAGVKIREIAAGAMRASIAFDDMMFRSDRAFTVMLRGQMSAKQMFDELFEYAAKTPFEMETAVVGAQRLAAYGIEAKKIVPTLKIIGDAAAALARPGQNEYVIDHLIRAMGQMENKGHVMTQEMIQFSEAGVRAWEYLADTLNVDVATAMKMVEDRAVDSSTAIAGILAGMERDYGGMAEELNKTIEGITTTIRDYAMKIGGLIVEPLYNQLKDMLYDFAFNTLPKWLQAVQDARDAADRKERVELANEAAAQGTLIEKQIKSLEAQKNYIQMQLTSIQGTGNEGLAAALAAQIADIDRQLNDLGAITVIDSLAEDYYNAAQNARLFYDTVLDLGGRAAMVDNVPLLENLIGSKAVIPEWDEWLNMTGAAAAAQNIANLLEEALNFSDMQSELMLLEAQLTDSLSSGAPVENITAIKDAIDELTRKMLVARQVMLMYNSGQLSSLQDVINAYRTLLRISDETENALKKSSSSASKSMEKSVEDIRSKISSLLKPTEVTELDMFQTQMGTYADKWDEYVRRLRDAANNAKSPWRNLIPTDVLQKGQAAIKVYLAEQERLFYSGQLNNPDWTKGGINWDAFVKAYEDMILEEAGKEALIDTAFQKLKEKYPDMKIDPTTIKRALGIASGKDEGQTFAQGYLGSIKDAKIPVAATGIIAAQSKENQKEIYAAGGAVGTVFLRGVVQGHNVDVRTELIHMLAGPVADEIESRKNRGGGGEKP